MMFNGLERRAAITRKVKVATTPKIGNEISQTKIRHLLCPVPSLESQFSGFGFVG